MLPITRNSLHVPHGLAILAAAVGLVASLAWPPSEQAPQNADQGRISGVHETMVQAPESPDAKHSEARDCRNSNCRGQSVPDSTLLPLLPGLRFF